MPFNLMLPMFAMAPKLLLAGKRVRGLSSRVADTLTRAALACVNILVKLTMLF